MPKVHETNAVNFLLAGALGIGEEHGTSNARELVIHLIDLGVVRHLFLELAKNMDRFSGPMTTAKNLAADGADFEAIARAAPSGDTDHSNRVPLKRLIAYALTHGVEVHLADDRSMAKLRGGNFDIRHASIKETFCEVTGQGLDSAKWYTPEAVGCLLLWGGAHFDSKLKSHLDDAPYIHGLPYIIMG